METSPLRPYRAARLAHWAVLCPLLLHSEAFAQSEPPLDTIAVADTRPAEPSPTLEPAAPTLLETIVVTGEKLGRSQTETASSVSITGARSIEDHGDESVQDLLRRVGNTVATDQGRFSIRGISNTGPDGALLGTPVATVYVDGVALDRLGLQSGLTDTYDVDQVEVLRGPQSTSQGRNALAGAIIVRTQEPEPYWSLRARARIEEDGANRYSAAGGGPLSDTLAFRLSYDGARDDGSITNITRNEDDWGRSENRLLRGRLKWTPDALPGLTVLAGITDTHARLGLRESYVPQSLALRYRTERIATADEPSWLRIDGTIYSTEIGYALTEHLSLSSTTGLLDSDNETHRDSDYSAAAVATGDLISSGRNLTQELRLNIRDWNGWNGVAGVYAGRFRNRYNAYNDGLRLASPLPGPGYLVIDQVGRADDDSDNIALFTELDYALTPRLTATAGLRYDRETSTTRAPFTVTRADLYLFPGALPINILPLGLVPSAADIPADGKFDALLPKAGLRYALSEQWSVFATYSEAYRAGGAEVLMSTGGISEYDPEYTRNYEIGLRAELFDRRLNLGLNLFHIDWRDQQVMVYTASRSDSYTANAADSTLSGGELELSWRPDHQWLTQLSIGAVRTRFKDFVDEMRGEDYSSKRFTRSPRLTGALSSSWRGESGLFWATSLSYTGAQYSEFANDDTSRNDSYLLLDARLGFQTPHWSLALFGRNLLDDFYTHARTPVGTEYGRPEPGTLVAYGDPRRYGLQFEIRY